MIANSEGDEAVTDFLQMLRQAMPDLHMELEDVFGVGGRAAPLLFLADRGRAWRLAPLIA